MTQSNTLTSEELLEYLTRLGQHINNIYARLDAIDTNITSQATAITGLQQTFDVIKREAILLLIDSLKQLPSVKVADLPLLPTTAEETH